MRLLNFVVSITRFASLAGYLFFFLIELDYVIIYFSFYYIDKKNSFRKKKHVIKF
jgi:hypothetical protein